MNSQRRSDPSPRHAARGRAAAADPDGSVPAMLARLEAAYPGRPAPADDRWAPVARLATLAAGCLGSWGLVMLVVHVAAPLV